MKKYKALFGFFVIISIIFHVPEKLQAETVVVNGVSKIRGSNVDQAIQKAITNALASVIEKKIKNYLPNNIINQYYKLLYSEIFSRPELIFSSFRILEQKNEKNLYVVKIEGIYSDRLLKGKIKSIGLTTKNEPLINAVLLEKTRLPFEIEEHLKNLGIRFNRMLMLTNEYRNEVEHAFSVNKNAQVVIVVQSVESGFIEFSVYKSKSEKPGHIVTALAGENISDSASVRRIRMLKLLNRRSLGLDNLKVRLDDASEWKYLIVEDIENFKEALPLINEVFTKRTDPKLGIFQLYKISGDKIIYRTKDISPQTARSAFNNLHPAFTFTNANSNDINRVVLKYKANLNIESKEIVTVGNGGIFSEFEYNNTIYRSNTISNGKLVGTLSSKKDVDFFRYKVGENGEVNIRFENRKKSSLNPVIKIYGNDKSLIKSTPVPRALTNSLSFNLTNDILTEDYIYIKIEDEFGSEGINSGSTEKYEYRLTIN